MVSRRELLGKAAVGAAAALAVGAAGKAVAATRAGFAAPGGGGAAGDGRHAGPHPGDAVAPGSPPADAAVSAAPEPAASVAPPPWALVRPLAAGSLVAHGWRLTDLTPVQEGSCVVTLQNARGRSQRVHLCRNDGSPQGLVYTRRLDLVVMNEGYGDLPTEEGLAQAVAALAHVLAANERKAPAGVVSELLPHAERVRRFAAAEGPSAYGKLR